MASSDPGVESPPTSTPGSMASSLGDRVVFDTEPIVAHATSERGAETVDTYLDAVGEGEIEGFLNRVNLTEIRVVLARSSGRSDADRYVQWLSDVGVRSVGTESTWRTAAEYGLEYDPTLGGSYALATADDLDATLLAGPVEEYEGVTEVRIRRFRDGPA